MPAKKRKFTDEQKSDILRQAEESGITQVLRQHNLSYSVFYRWKEQMKSLKSEKSLPDTHLQMTIKKLLEENATLKKIIAEQALKIEIQQEKINKHNKNK